MSANVMTIRQSENYSRFHLLPSINRDITSQRITKMKLSVIKMGCIRPIVISKLKFPTGVEHDYIIDGQSLFQALMALEKPIPYVYIETGDDPSRTVECMAMLNATSNKWEMKDYVHAWKYIKRSYVDLENYALRYGIHYSGIVAIAMNIESTAFTTPIIKDGTFEITNSNFHDLVGMASDLLTVEGMDGIARLPNAVACELVRYYNNVETYDHNVIRQRMSDHSDLIRATSQASVGAVLREHVFILRTH